MKVLANRVRYSSFTSRVCKDHGRRALALAFAASLFVSTATSRAATYTYTPTTNGATDQWSAGTNWAGGVPISGTETELKFMTNSSNSGIYTSNNNNAGTFILNKLTYAGTYWGQTFNITGNTLKFSGPDRVINLDATISSAYFYFKIPTITSEGPLTIQGNGGGIFLFYSKISNGATAASLIKNGSSKVTFWYTNDYTGGTTLNAGTLNIDASNPFGSGPLTINGGTLDSDYGFTLTTNNTQAWNGNFTFNGSGSGDGNLGTGAVTMNANRTVTVNRKALIVGGSISDGGNVYSLSKAGSGTLTLSGSSSYTGATTVKSGTLIVKGSLSDNSAVTVGDAASPTTVAVLGGSGTVGNVTAVGNSVPANTGASIDPGNATNVAGSLDALSLSVTNGSHLAMQIGGRTPGGDVSTGYDQVIVDGAVNVAGGDLKLTVNGTPFFGPKDTLYLIVNNSGSPVTGTFGTVTLNGSPVADINNIVLNGRQFQLVYNANSASSDDVANDVALVAVPDLWQTVPIGGGGYVIGLVTDTTGNSIYCHTDVGGAFRWDAMNSEWVSITDAIVSSTTSGCTALSGIISLAIDPANSNKIYVAAGSWTWDSLHGIFASNDGGASWTQINSSIVVNGNGAFRATGERLVVDPNNSNILWFGSSQDGLQKGVCTSGSWAWTQVPSTSVPFGKVASGDKAGVTFVACDKSGTNTIVYAGVYDSVGTGTTGGIYRSTDGTNWSMVAGVSCVTPVRGHVAPGGTLYATKWGKVVKLLRSGTLQDITPVASVNYSGVGVALSDTTGNTVYIAESNGGAQNGRVWRTGSGGSSWTVQSTVYTKLGEYDGTSCVTRPGWFSSTAALMVSATNANELWAGDFLGVMRTQNAQDIGGTPGATWNSLQKGQEEFCVSALKAPPSGPLLISAGADLGGYLHNDITVRPYGTGGTRLKNPSWGSTSGLDYCESNPNTWIRAWDNPASNGGTGGVSVDSGSTWMVFGEIDRKLIDNNGTSTWETWDVGTYLSTQRAKGNTLVTLVLASEDCIPASGLLTLFNSKQAGTTVAPRIVVNGTTTLTTIADSYVSDSATTNNYGTSTELQVSYYWSGNVRLAYLKFDLSSVPTITSGTLRVNRKAAYYPNQVPVGVFACANTSWVESGTTGITWSNKTAPLAGSNPSSLPTFYDGATALAGGRVAVSSTNPNLMVWMPEGSSNYAHYSNDRGVTWKTGTAAPVSQIASRFIPGAVIQPLTADRVNGKLYIAKFGVGGWTHVIYASTDGGANWVVTGTVAANSNNVWRAQIVASPVANDVWVSDDGVSGTTAGGIWRSINGGATWAKVSTGVITAVRQVSFGKSQTGAGYTVFINGYKNGSRGIYRSEDYGVSWVLVDIAPTVTEIDVLEGDRQNYGGVYIGTAGRGIFTNQ